jgi:hypothetical protein
MAKVPMNDDKLIVVKKPVIEVVTAYIIGRSPLLFQRLALRAQQELLFPGGRKRTDADRAGVLKHDPLNEYQESCHRFTGSQQPTRLGFPASAFRKAVAAAALDLPGATKSEIGRLIWIEGNDNLIPVYGIPHLLMAGVKTAGMNRTPDIRTWCALPQWCCRVDFSILSPRLNAAALGNLLELAGLVVGVGDGRQEKGKLSYGQFMTVDGKNTAYRQIVQSGGIRAQDAALADPGFMDEYSRDLFQWFTKERKARAIVTSIRNREQPDEVAPMKRRPGRPRKVAA